MRVPENLPWWIPGIFGCGIALVTAFGPEILPEALRWVAFAFGIGLIGVSALLLAHHFRRPTKMPILKPKRGWLPFAAAHFDIPRDESLQRSSTVAIWGKSILESSCNSVPGDGALALPDGSRFEGVRIDWERHYFAWSWSLARFPDRRKGWMIFPWQLDSGSPNEDIPDEVWQRLRSGVALTWILMRKNVDDLIGTHRAIVWARRASPTAPFEIVPLDAWQHFTVSDWERGVAIANMDTLYSVHIEVAS